MNLKTQIITLLFAVAASTLQARVVTLTVQNYNGQTNETAEVFIESYEVAEVLAYRDNSSGTPTTMLLALKDNQGVAVPSPDYAGTVKPLFVAGPATVRLYANTGRASGLCTIRITPEAYPPDKSILVPPGTGGANIALEWSTNLVNWTSTTNGVYTNLPVATFFRINAGRIP